MGPKSHVKSHLVLARQETRQETKKIRKTSKESGSI